MTGIVFSSATLRHLAWVAQKENPEWRKGQAIWNTAVKHWPKQVEPLRATEKDCFYTDTKIGEFVEALQVADWT